MKNNIIDLSKHIFTPDEHLVFDTNIWLLLYPFPSSPKNNSVISKYSHSFKSMLKGQSVIHMDTMILSEYLNRYFRAEFEAHNKQPGTHVTRYTYFKEYRNSPDFQSVAQTAIHFASQILIRCDRVIAARPQFSIGDVTRILDDLNKGMSDFNDLLLADLCQRHGWKLVTHDADFVRNNFAIDILTHNERILQNGIF